MSGVEQPLIRGLKAMAIVRWSLLAAVALLAAGTWWVHVVRGDSAVSGPETFYCPMHPEIRSPAPGTCPICFMKLEPIPEDRMAGHGAEAPTPLAPATVGERPADLANVMLTLERRQAVGIATEPASKRSVARELRLPALIETPEKSVAEVRVRTPGFVEKVAPIESGARVKAGQPLLWMYSPELLRAQEEFLTARRLRGGERDGGEAEVHQFGDRVVEAARQRLLLLGLHPSDLELVIAQNAAQRLVAVRSPADGVVTSRKVAIGTQAMPEMMLFEITDLSVLWATATLSAGELPAVPIGSNGQFVSRRAQRAYAVAATQVEPRMASETRTARLRFVAKNADGSLLPGDIGEVVVTLPADEYVLVPRDAVVDLGTVQYAFVEEAVGLFAPRVVQAGPLIGEERAVLKGLAAGERVVSRGAFVLDSESRLQAAVAPRPAAADGGRR